MSSKAVYGRRATRKLAAQAAVARANGQPIPSGTSISGQPESAPVKRVAAYIRISTDELHQPFSLEAQQARLMSYISIQPGWEFAGIIYQDEKSGATLERPGLKKALAAAKAGKFDILLVYRVDRLSRSLRGLVDILDQLSKSNVAFQSATEPVDTSSAVGRMLIQMLGVFAQFEREILIDRRGFRTRSGKPWSGNGILTILRNRTYLGEVYFRGTWYRVDDHHPAIIDEEVFDKAQQILDGRSDDYSVRVSSNSEYALSGGIKCARCGAHYVGTAATGRTKRYRYYTCYTRVRYGPDACSAERLPADEVEEKMTAALLDTYQQTDLIQEAISVIAAEIAEIGSKRDKELATIDANLTEVTGKIDRYLQAFEKGTMSDAAASDRVTLLKDHRRALRAHRNQLDAEPVAEPAAEVSADDLASMREEIKDLVTHGAYGVKNALFRALVDEIQVTGRHKIKPYFRVRQTMQPQALGLGFAF